VSCVAEWAGWVHVRVTCPGCPACSQLLTGLGLNAVLYCRLVAVYCCEGGQDVTPYIPAKWPPPLLVPAGEPAPTVPVFPGMCLAAERLPDIHLVCLPACL
jgi:hypothetical protein